MKLRNGVAAKYAEGLAEAMSVGHKGKLGYVIQVNLKNINECIKEYLQIRNELIVKYGEKLEDDKYKLDQKNVKNFNKFMEEIQPIAEVEQDIAIISIQVDEVWDKLDSVAMDQLDFMLNAPKDLQ